MVRVPNAVNGVQLHGKSPSGGDAWDALGAINGVGLTHEVVRCFSAVVIAVHV